MDTNGEFKPSFRPRISLHRFVFYFITLAAIILIYFEFSEMQLIKELFLRSNFFWLFSVVVLQAFSYYFMALNYRDVLRVKDLEVGVRELFPVTFVIQFLNQALPSAGISGQAFFVQYLKKFGLPLSEGIGRAILELMTLYMAFGTFFIASAVIMLQGDIISQHPEARYFIYVFSFFAVVGVLLFFFLQRKKRSRVAQWIIGKLHAYFEKRNKKNGQDDGSNHAAHVSMLFDQFTTSVNIGVLRQHSKPFWSAYLWQNIILLANVLTLLFLSYAIGFKISLSVAFITFTLTKFLSMVSFIPGAIGVFEGGMTLILVSFGVPAQPAFAMTLLLRAFTFWFPMPLGWVLYKWILHRQELEHPYEDLQV